MAPDVIVSGKRLARAMSSQRDTGSIARPEERFWVRRISPQLRSSDLIEPFRGAPPEGAPHEEGGRIPA
jgi:hypothetical protein